MTLLLALCNESYSIVLGDRRLTSNGSVRDDESNKLCILFCDDARVAFAFTGLAAAGDFRTQDWLRETLAKIGESQHTLNEILAALQEQATRAFSQLPTSQRGVAFLITGFRYSPQSSKLCYCLSNFATTGTVPTTAQFCLRPLLEDSDATVVAAGCKTSLVDKDYTSLRLMLTSNNPPPRVLRKAVQILRRAAKDKRSMRLIGQQCNSGIIRNAPDTIVTSTYHSSACSNRAFGPDVVLAVGGQCIQVTGSLLSAGEYLSGPEIRKSDECWCGSGKRFGSCHLKKFGSVYVNLAGFRRPMAPTIAFRTKSYYPSGSTFVVQSAFV